MSLTVSRCILVTALVFAGTLSAQLQFAAPQKAHLPLEQDDRTGVAVADIDSDGDDDIVAGSLGGFFPTPIPGPLRVLRNDGGGRFTEVAASVGLGAVTDIGDVALGDVDNDGDPDLVVATGGPPPAQSIMLFSNNGGVFVDVTTTRLPPMLPAVGLIELVDLDSDTDLDLVALAGPVLLLENTGIGSGTFAQRMVSPPLPATVPLVFDVACGDVVGNGYVDLVLAVHSTFGSSQNRLFANQGGWSFADVTATNLPMVNNFSLGVDLGDVDGDGSLDLLVGNGEGSFGQNQNELLLNNGSGVFSSAPPGSIPADNDDTEAVALCDVNGDTFLDAVIANSGRSRLYLNNGSGVLVDAPSRMPPHESSTLSLAHGDWNGDGETDLYFGNQLGPDDVLFHDGAGGFVSGTARPFWHRGGDTTAVVAADFDGDGLLDLYLGLDGQFLSITQDLLYLNDGLGGLLDRTDLLPPWPSATKGAAVGDFDGNGTTDIATAADQSPPRNSLYLNQGSAGFIDASTNLPQPFTGSRAVAAADADCDGDLDLVYADNVGDRLLINDGAGVFTNATFPPGPPGTTALVFLDADGTGGTDLVLTSPDRLYLNTCGTFADRSATHLPGATASQAVAAGDVDGDGSCDLVFAGAGLLLYTNNGAGVFTDRSSSLPPTSGVSTSVDLADVDGDGDRDLIVGTSGQNLLFLNDGLGTFTDVTSARLPARIDNTRAVHFADLDDDMDPEILVGNGMGYSYGIHARDDYALLNHHRQSHAPRLAQLGAFYTVDFTAEPGYATGALAAAPFLNLALAPNPVPVPPFGNFRVSLLNVIALPPVLIPPASGSGRLRFRIPAPLPPGFRLASQAVFLQSSGQLLLGNVLGDLVIR